MMSKKEQVLRKRIAFVMVLLGLVFVVLVVNLARIQFWEGPTMAAKAQSQLRENKRLHSPRGTIYDRAGRELAVSNMNKSLFADPEGIKDPEKTAAILAPLLEMKLEEVRERVSLKGRFVWLKRTMEPAMTEQVKKAIKENKLGGLGFLEESKRYYPSGALAAQVIGFVGTDDVGLDGLELSLDKTIRGSWTEQSVDTDMRGTPIFKSIFTFAAQKRTQSVYLTLDSNIQFLAEQGLDKAMATTGAAAATLIVMNPKNGEILAMASRPTFNPNQFWKADSNHWRNRAVSFIYEPGSTFKALVAAAAVQENEVRPDEWFTDKGYIEVGDRRIKNWSGESYGNVPFSDIFKNSLNTGFVAVGLRVGAQRMCDYAKAFGLGRATGVELPGEESGLLFEAKEMRPSDIGTMAIGQSIAVTPLQLLAGVSAIANDGVLLKPHIIKEIRGGDGSLVKKVEPEAVRQAVSPQTAKTIAMLMEKVVSEGGGKNAAVKGYRIAGKTGTAEKLNEKGGYYANRYIASFVGFAPVEDPQISILLIIDDPNGAYYGGQIAAPIAGDILGQILRYLNIAPQGSEGKLPEVRPLEMMPALPPKRESRPLEPAPPGKVLVPDLRGKSIREAGELLSKLGLALVPVGSGRGVGQDYSPYTAVEPGTEVKVRFEPD